MKSVYVANRGEVVARISQTCKNMGIECLATVLMQEKNEPWHQDCTRVSLVEGQLSHYLDIQLQIDQAKALGADCIHPGWGFLSENALFAREVEAAGLLWIGPTPDQMEALGDKFKAKERASSLNIPQTPAYKIDDNHSLSKSLSTLTFPVIVKPLAGGGGKGMHTIQTADDVQKLVTLAMREAHHAFGDSTCLVESYLDRPKHIEVQVMGDGKGEVMVLGFRDCTVQRRSQKIIEESVSNSDAESTLNQLAKYSRDLCASIKYRGAGTIEFLLHDGQIYFMEVNTRLQVEHGVTELVSGLDLVQMQLNVAAQVPLTYFDYKHSQGHAIEARIYAENPSKHFMPATGQLLYLGKNQDSNIRVDTGVGIGTSVSSRFDPMLMKIIAKGRSRHEAIDRLDMALINLAPLGVPTNVNYLRYVLQSPDFLAQRHDTQWAERNIEEFISKEKESKHAVLANLARMIYEPALQAPRFWSERLC